MKKEKKELMFMYYYRNNNSFDKERYVTEISIVGKNISFVIPATVAPSKRDRALKVIIIIVIIVNKSLLII